MGNRLGRAGLGLLGGLLGSFLMRAALTRWHAVTGNDSRYGAFGLDREADVNSIQLLSTALTGNKVTDETAFKIATQFHYSYGALGGIAYALASPKFPLLRSGSGTVFGSLVWLFGDEIPIALSGISDPSAKSAYSHLAALVGHLIYGSSINLVVQQGSLMFTSSEQKE